MNSLESFAVGALFVLVLGAFALIAFVVLKLADANKLAHQSAEAVFLASKANNASELAAALAQRDEARANNLTLQKELQTQPGALANIGPKGDNEPDTLMFNDIPLIPVRR